VPEKLTINFFWSYLSFFCFHFIISVFTGGNIYILDLAAKIDQCAEFMCKSKWGEIEFPPPFGREALPEVGSNIIINIIISLKINLFSP